MSWNRRTRNSIDAGIGFESMGWQEYRGQGKHELVLPIPGNVREQLKALYRERDEADARRYARGEQKVRGTVWALGLRRLERGEEVYESFAMLSAAGVELNEAVRAILEELPADWCKVCRIDPEGVVRAASLRGRKRSSQGGAR